MIASFAYTHTHTEDGLMDVWILLLSWLWSKSKYSQDSHC